MTKWRYRRVFKSLDEIRSEGEVTDGFIEAEQNLHDLMSAGYDDVPSHSKIMYGARKRLEEERRKCTFTLTYKYVREEVSV